MKAPASQLKIILIILTTLLTNSLLLTYILSINTSALIANKSLESDHKTLINYVLTGKGDITSAVTAEEASHMADVRNIYKFLPIIIVVLLAISIFNLKKMGDPDRLKLLLHAQIELIIVAITATIFFTAFFTYFHYIFFPQGNWSFSAESTLIRLYPEDFWKTAAVIIFCASLIELILVQAVIKAFSNNNSLAKQ